MPRLSLRLAALALVLAFCVAGLPLQSPVVQGQAPTATPTTAPTATATATVEPTATATPTTAPATATPVAPAPTATPTITPTQTLVGAPAPQFTPTPGVPSSTTLYIPLIMKRATHGDSGSTVETGVQVQNLGNAQADLTMTYYDRDGFTAQQWTERGSVAAGDSFTFFTPSNVNLPAGFVGSAVLQSTQPVGALVNEQTFEAPRYFFGTFVTPRTPAQTVYLPYALKQVGTRSSTISVQNTGPVATTVNVNFVTRDGQISRIQVPLPPFSARQIRLAERPELAAGLDAAVILQSDQPLVAASDVYDSATGIFHLYSGLSSGAVEQNLPLLFKERNGWNSEVRAQNIGNAPVNVRVRVQPTGGGTEITTAPVSVPANAPYTFRPIELAAIPNDFVGSSTVEAVGGNLVAVSTQQNVGRGTGMAYDAFTPGSATTRISVPLVFKRRNGFDTGVQVQNLDATDAQARITYRLSTGQQVVDFGVVPAGGSLTFYQPDNPQIPDGSVGSAVVENLGGGQRLVAIVNQVNYERGGDASSTYEGLNY